MNVNGQGFVPIVCVRSRVRVTSAHTHHTPQHNRWNESPLIRHTHTLWLRFRWKHLMLCVAGLHLVLLCDGKTVPNLSTAIVTESMTFTSFTTIDRIQICAFYCFGFARLVAVCVRASVLRYWCVHKSTFINIFFLYLFSSGSVHYYYRHTLFQFIEFSHTSTHTHVPNKSDSLPIRMPSSIHIPIYKFLSVFRRWFIRPDRRVLDPQHSGRSSFAFQHPTVHINYLWDKGPVFVRFVHLTSKSLEPNSSN